MDGYLAKENCDNGFLYQVGKGTMEDQLANKTVVLMKDSMNTFKLYASGRRFCTGMVRMFLPYGYRRVYIYIPYLMLVMPTSMLPLWYVWHVLKNPPIIWTF